VTRGVEDLLADLAEAADAAAELVSLGKKRWDTERPLRLAGEAVIGRLGDIGTKLNRRAVPEHGGRQPDPKIGELVGARQRPAERERSRAGLPRKDQAAGVTVTV
jgi:hypothetical protein